MQNRQLKFTLIYNFIITALLMNCVGVVIMEMVDQYHISLLSASWLEAFKDVSVVVGSFFLASLIPKLGYKKSMLFGVGIEILACLLMATHTSFLTARIFFVMVGIAFALLKITIYSTVGLITANDNEHAAFLSQLEGFFMGGLLLGFWLFGAFITLHRWTDTYWLLAGFGVVGLVLLLSISLDESALLASETQQDKEAAGFKMIFKLLAKGIVWLFILMAFAYVFIEQGITTWLPTYNEHVLHVSSVHSVALASLFAAGLVIGRLSGGFIMKYFNWKNILLGGIVLALVVLLYSIHITNLLPLDIDQPITVWENTPLVAYLIPVVGVMIGAVYPILCSSILSSQPVKLQSSVASLIVLVSALGGTIGSRVVGTVFGVLGGSAAIKVPVVPLFLLLILLIPYYYRLRHITNEPKSSDFK